MDIELIVDDQRHELGVEPRMLLIQVLRERLGVTGPHVGCQSGRCGACTVLLNGNAVKSCMTLAVQASGSEVVTAAALDKHSIGRVLQTTFHEKHALQCGYCTPGMLSAAVDLLQSCPLPNEEEVRQALRGNLCRCTGYQNIIEAVQAAAVEIAATGERVR